MISYILLILLALIAVLIMALLLPMKLFFSASGGSDRGAVLSGRIMLFNGLAGAGVNFDHSRLSALLFLGIWQAAGFEVTSSAERFRERRKEKASRKKVKEPKISKEAKTVKESEIAKESEKEIEKGVKLPEGSFTGLLANWRLQAGKYKKYASMILGAVRDIIGIDYLRVRLTFGFTDPVMTGKVVGFIFAINSILPKSLTIHPEWDFSREVFAGKASIKLTFRNYLFWLYLIKFFLIFRKTPENSFAVAGQNLTTQEA